MRYVILRDDDTNALTPVECLERLYRPFLDRGLPVSLATIPNVSTESVYAPGHPELFLMAKRGKMPPVLPIGGNEKLVRYIRNNPLYHVIQHGCRHDFVHNRREFDHNDRGEIVRRMEEGLNCLAEAGFPRPETFVAPYDKLSRPAHREVARRFPILSGGWYELPRLPFSWWPRYFRKKWRQEAHWKAGNMILLTHPGCHLSYHRGYGTIMSDIIQSIQSRKLTVLVTHWWEYFRYNQSDEQLIEILHSTADYLAGAPDIQVISFQDLMRKDFDLNQP